MCKCLFVSMKYRVKQCGLEKVGLDYCKLLKNSCVLKNIAEVFLKLSTIFCRLFCAVKKY